MAQQTARFVRVPLPIVQALLGYLDEKPHKEVRPFIEVLSSLPVEEDRPALVAVPDKTDPPKE